MRGQCLRAVCFASYDDGAACERVRISQIEVPQVHELATAIGDIVAMRLKFLPEALEAVFGTLCVRDALANRSLVWAVWLCRTHRYFFSSV